MNFCTMSKNHHFYNTFFYKNRYFILICFFNLLK